MVAVIAQTVKIAGNFIVQTAFVKTLGATYLGANGLFTNLISFLSFAELGIGAAFSFSLYEPLANNNYNVLSSIMSLYRKVYNFIGCFILLSGSILAFFVPYLTKGNEGIPHIQIYFFLYLLSTVVSYFFTYNRSLLIADQCGYIDSVNQLNFSIFRYVFQILALIYRSYIWYLIAQIICNLLANISITLLTRKRYPLINEYVKNKPSKKIIFKLKQNIIGTISSKIGLVVVNGTDNILISKFVGLTKVGIYSNYSLVMSGVTVILNQALISVVASFGNLGVVEKENKEKQVILFNEFVFYNAVFSFFIGLVSLIFFQPFITIWVGQEYKLPILTINLIVINFVLSTFRPALNMINAYGLFWGYRYKSIIEAIVNFGLSLYLVSMTNLGINGVLIGTIISNLVINSWWDPLILFKGAYNMGILKFYLKYISYLGIYIFFTIIYNIYLNYLQFSTKNVFLLISYFLLVCVITLILILFSFYLLPYERKLYKNIINRVIR